jgi:hypothetical protein
VEDPLNALRISSRIFLAGCMLVCSLSVFAQDNAGAMSPYQGESDGVNVGGKWIEFHSEDKMTGAKKARFELQADNYFKEDADFKPRVELFCSDGKLNVADFDPGEKMRPNRPPGPWGQPQIEVMVRVNDNHYYRGWNWLPNHRLSMDKGTTRELIGAQVFKLEVPTRDGGRQIAEFSPAGLDLGRVKQVCDLTSKKPSKD